MTSLQAALQQQNYSKQGVDAVDFEFGGLQVPKRAYV